MPLSKTITIQGLYPCAVHKYEKLCQLLLKLIQGDTKNGNFWKTQQKLKKSKEKNYWQKLKH